MPRVRWSRVAGSQTTTILQAAEAAGLSPDGAVRMKQPGARRRAVRWVELPAWQLGHCATYVTRYQRGMYDNDLVETAPCNVWLTSTGELITEIDRAQVDKTMVQDRLVAFWNNSEGKQIPVLPDSIKKGM
jgi:hypothetical protein